MVILPVVERELRVTARRKSTYRLRLLAVLAMVGTFGWQMLTWRSDLYSTSSLQGKRLFESLIWVAFFFAASSGVIATSDCVSSEKRDGTLGLLFLTDLKGYEVILGKLAAHSIHIVFALIAFVPIMAVPFLMGGITAPELAKAALALISLIFISLSIGTYVSTCSRNERRAMFFTVLLLFLVICFPFFLTALTFSRPSSVAWWGLIFSPGFPILLSFDRFFPCPPSVYWISLVWEWALAGFFLVLASVKIPHSWKDAKPAREKPAAITTEKPRKKDIIRGNPFEWLAMQGETRVQNAWIFVISLFVLWFVFLITLGRVLFDRGAVMVVMFLLNGFFKFWIASESTRRFMEDRKNNAFELLLSTPLNEINIINGQCTALLRQFGGPLFFTVIWEIILLVGQEHNDRGWGEDPVRWEMSMVIFLVLDLVTLSWFGMWLGIRLKSRAIAIILNWGTVIILPWVLSYLLLSTFFSGSTRSFDGEQVLQGCQIFLTLIFDAVIIFWACNKLRKNFRKIVTEGQGRSGD